MDWYAHTHAYLTGFMSLGIDEVLSKDEMKTYAMTFLPNNMAEEFQVKIASLYDRLGNKTNNDNQQEEKFKTVKAAMEIM
jgi:hypothetical protein